MSSFASSSSQAQAQLPSHLVSSPWLRFESSQQSLSSPYFQSTPSSSNPSYQGSDESDDEEDSPLSNYRGFPITPPPLVFNLTLPTKRSPSSTSTTPSLSSSHSSSSSQQSSSSNLPLTPTVSRHLNLNLGLVSPSSSSSSWSSAASNRKQAVHQDTPRPIEPRDGYFGRSTMVSLPRRKEAMEVGRSLKRKVDVEKWQIESVVVWPSSNSRRMGIVA
ncbi:hypothetical protein BDY24DRAFT_380404 [Mrakia frigida]|uniref:uncharacterized protein n=1 Tax=Mrakia frigida TaxID=29902 RepID=UPI003FCC1559